MMPWIGGPGPRGPSFWDYDCPDRGVGLHHAHWNECTVNHGNHFADECCHCNMRASQWKAPVTSVTKVDDGRPLEDHEYLWSIAGRCRRDGCGRTEPEHVKLVKGASDSECAVDHGSLTVKRLIGDSGWEWSRCPRCGSQIEPRLPDEEPTATSRFRRRTSGVGRMPVIQRDLDRWTRIRESWLGGFYLS